MFTGIVTGVGTVVERIPREGAVEFIVHAPEYAVGLDDGESVAVDGVCFTVTGRDAESFRFTSVLTTLDRTTFGELEVGRRVNLERIKLPPDIAALTVPRGSLAVDGVSLTVASLEGEVAEIALIPYTWTHTSLDRLEIGDPVNLEADLIGKYVERLLTPYAGGDPGT
jgi:riboflavin synthase